MKIGVIGPEITVHVIRKVAEKDLPDIQFAYRCSEFFEQSADSAALFQSEKDVDAILSEGRKKALARENEIVAEAKEAAARVMERAEREIELEKSKVRDEVKQEMIGVAREMAGKFVATSLDAAAQAKLIDGALNEMGEDTWQS